MKKGNNSAEGKDRPIALIYRGVQLTINGRVSFTFSGLRYAYDTLREATSCVDELLAPDSISPPKPIQAWVAREDENGDWEYAPCQILGFRYADCNEGNDLIRIREKTKKGQWLEEYIEANYLCPDTKRNASLIKRIADITSARKRKEEEIRHLINKRNACLDRVAGFGNLRQLITSSSNKKA